MVMRFLLPWPSMHNKMTFIRRGFLKIAGSCRGAMFFSARHIGSLTPWTSIGHLRACQGPCPSRCFHGCQLLPDTPPFIPLPLACGPNSKYQRTPERNREMQKSVWLIALLNQAFTTKDFDITWPLSTDFRDFTLLRRLSHLRRRNLRLLRRRNHLIMEALLLGIW